MTNRMEKEKRVEEGQKLSLSEEVRELADDIKELENSSLKAKQIWDITNKIQNRLMYILENRLFTDL